MDVVWLAACVIGGGSVAVDWLCDKWLVESHAGSGCEFLVGEWFDVLDGCVEPSASANAAGGMVDGHCSCVEVVGVCGRMQVADKRCEFLLLVFWGCIVRCDFGKVGPES